MLIIQGLTAFTIQLCRTLSDVLPFINNAWNRLNHQAATHQPSIDFAKLFQSFVNICQEWYC